MSWHSQEKTYLAYCLHPYGTTGRGHGFGAQRHRQRKDRPAAALVENKDGVLHPKPEFFGKPDDVADWVDRLKAIGNGQVPAVAAGAFAILSEIVNHLK